MALSPQCPQDSLEADRRREMLETNPGLLKINPPTAFHDQRFARLLVAALVGYFGIMGSLFAIVFTLAPHNVYTVKNRLREVGAATTAHVQFLFVQMNGKTYQHVVRFGYIVENGHGGSNWGTDEIVSPTTFGRLHVGQRLTAVYDRTFPMTVRLDLPDDPAVGPHGRDPLVPGLEIAAVIAALSVALVVALLRAG